MSGNNNAGFAALDKMLATLRAVPQLAQTAAPDCARAVAGAIGEQVEVGTDPYGKQWKPTQDGKAPLRNAAGAVSVIANGSRLVIEVSGVEALHHSGAARGYHGGSTRLGGFRREIIPKREIPPRMRGVLRIALENAFAKQGG
jgi:hypothetical protein